MRQFRIVARGDFGPVQPFESSAHTPAHTITLPRRCGDAPPAVARSRLSIGTNNHPSVPWRLFFSQSDLQAKKIKSSLKPKYVCVYVCICVCMLYVCMFVCVYVCMYVCPYVCMYVCLYVCMYVCLHVCMYVGMNICVCMYVCMYVCIYMYAYD